MGLPRLDSVLLMVSFAKFFLRRNILWVYPEVDCGSTLNPNPAVLAPVIQIVWQWIVGLPITHKTHFG